MESGASGYRADVDGLRAVAIGAVVAYHAGLSAFVGGFVGVDIFFVISGYLICGIVYREALEKRFTFARFYARRARRILPALLVMLAVVSIVCWFALTPRELSAYALDVLATLVGQSNNLIMLQTGYFADTARLNPLLMTWSLGVEEQFYIVLPILLVLWLRVVGRGFGYVLVAATLASFALSILVLRYSTTAAFYTLPPRFWEIGLGGCLAVLQIEHGERLKLGGAAENVAALIGAGLIGLSIFALPRGAAFPGWWVLAPTLGALLLLATPGSVVNRRLLSSRPVVFVGLVSYAWYLWHWPMLSLTEILTGAPLGPIVGSTVVAVAFGVAVLSWAVVERRLRLRRLGEPAILMRYAALLAGCALPLVAIAGAKGVPGRFDPALGRLEAGLDANRADPCLTPFSRSRIPAPSVCRPAPEGRPVVALVGDSHAAALAPALREQAKANGQRLWELTKMSCPPLLGASLHIPAYPAHAERCAAFDRAALEALKAEPAIRTVILAAAWSSPMALAGSGERYTASETTGDGSSARVLEAGLTRMVQALKAAGKTVLIVQDAPVFTFDPVHAAESPAIPLRRAVMTRFGAEREATTSSSLQPDPARAIVARVAADQGARWIDPWRGLCDGDRCRFAGPSGLLYVDRQHLSPEGARAALAGFTLPPSSPGP